MQKPPPQTQEQPGLQKDMKPGVESTKLEVAGEGLKEYKGVGKLKNKSAIITGGDSGIGRSVAVLFAREGCDITIVYLPEEQADANNTKKLVEQEDRKCQCIPFDLKDLKNIKTIVDKHVSTYGGLDILVNNASTQIMCKDFAEIDLDNVEKTFRTNILQMIAMTKFAVPHLKKGSKIINTSSVTAFRGSPALVDYSSTKAAIVGMTRSLAKMLYPKGIAVNAVAMGPVFTPLQPASRPADDMEGFGSATDIGRSLQPSEVAPSYVFLASSEALAYSGQILHPNLGDYMG